MQRAVVYEWAIVGKQENKTRAIKGKEAVDDGICVPVCVERRENAGGALGSCERRSYAVFLSWR